MANSNDPFKVMTEFQQAWMEAWANSSRHVFDMWRRMFDLQQQVIHKAVQHHRDHVEISDGPSFTDKYGKRAHDIDPERDV